MSAVKISDAERRVLAHLADKPWDSPSNIGWAMVEGRDTKAAHKASAQGLGRIGGGMCRKMIGKGLVMDASRKRNGYPAYAITDAGRALMKK
jgi:hypothetical protein